MSNQYPKKKVNAGEVRISESVVCSIAAVAAKEVDGVAAIPACSCPLFQKTSPVSVKTVNEMVEITIRIALMHGHRLTTVAEQVQQNVKENVQSMTGIIVSKVHVIAADIIFED